jgi:hypothetical protein
MGMVPSETFSIEKVANDFLSEGESNSEMGNPFCIVCGHVAHSSICYNGCCEILHAYPHAHFQLSKRVFSLTVEWTLSK